MTVAEMLKRELITKRNATVTDLARELIASAATADVKMLNGMKCCRRSGRAADR